ncbi:MAG: hypothetical protein M1353_07950 [Nitrospirae bacterium]|nr:hypothetical protein [Nitrospirota bacterium]
MAKNLFKDVPMDDKKIKEIGKGADMVKNAELKAKHKGRQKKEQKATSQVTVYFTPEEKARLDDFIGKLRGVSISSYIKMLLAEKGVI